MISHLSKNFGIVLSLAMSLGLSVACSGSGGSSNSGGSVHVDSVTSQAVVGGCALQMPASAQSSGASACMDFFEGPSVTTSSVSAACAQQGQTYVSSCPTTGVTGLCKMTVSGLPVALLVYNDSNASDLQSLQSSCQQQGGQYNP